VVLLGGAVAGCQRGALDLLTRQAPSREAPDGGGGVEAGASDGGRPSCTSDDACAASNEVCSTDKGRCVQCVSDAQCNGKRCDLAQNVCVDCIDASDCAGLVCDPDTHYCLPGCASALDCNRLSPICSGTRGICVQCETDQDCHFGETCSRGQCVECQRDADCPASRPHCFAFVGRCFECLTSDQCRSGQTCEPFEQQCR
jgi:hypothetical protein